MSQKSVDVFCYNVGIAVCELEEVLEQFSVDEIQEALRQCCEKYGLTKESRE